MQKIEIRLEATVSISRQALEWMGQQFADCDEYVVTTAEENRPGYANGIEMLIEHLRSRGILYECSVISVEYALTPLGRALMERIKTGAVNASDGKAG